VKGDALRELSAVDSKEAVDALAQCARGSEREMRLAAIQALAITSPRGRHFERRVQILSSALGDEDLGLASAAVYGLSTLIRPNGPQIRKPDRSTADAISRDLRQLLTAVESEALRLKVQSLIDALGSQ
jgi:hypothetical protein